MTFTIPTGFRGDVAPVFRAEPCRAFELHGWGDDLCTSIAQKNSQFCKRHDRMADYHYAQMLREYEAANLPEEGEPTKQDWADIELTF